MPLIIDGTQIKRVVIDGVPQKKIVVNGTTVFQANITLTNIVGNNYAEQQKVWSDAGYDVGTVNIITPSMTKGHRYFVYTEWEGWAYIHSGTTMTYNSSVQWKTGDETVTDLVGKWTTTAFSTESIPNRRIITAESSNAFNLYYQRNNSSQGTTIGRAYMIVDLTDLEATTGITYTSDTFWSFIGSTPFYGSKEFEI